jgi:hypothetical protein
MEDVFEFVRGVFGSDQLQVAPPNLVTPLRVPDRSKQFLITVGLPRRINFAGGELAFNLLDRLPVLRDLFPECAGRIDPGWDDCRFLSFEYGAGYVLNQGDGGSIWRVLEDSADSEFVNSSVEMFGWFLAEYTRVGMRSYPKAGDGAVEALDQMEQGMRAMDSRAMTDEAAFWPVVIEDTQFYRG